MNLVLMIRLRLISLINLID